MLSTWKKMCGRYTYTCSCQEILGFIVSSRVPKVADVLMYAIMHTWTSHPYVLAEHLIPNPQACSDGRITLLGKLPTRFQNMTSSVEPKIINKVGHWFQCIPNVYDGFSPGLHVGQLSSISHVFMDINLYTRLSNKSRNHIFCYNCLRHP